jgi:hypothetical protein
MAKNTKNWRQGSYRRVDNIVLVWTEDMPVVRQDNRRCGISKAGEALGFKACRTAFYRTNGRWMWGGTDINAGHRYYGDLPQDAIDAVNRLDLEGVTPQFPFTIELTNCWRRKTTPKSPARTKSNKEWKQGIKQGSRTVDPVNPAPSNPMYGRFAIIN